MRLNILYSVVLATIVFSGCEPKRAITADPVYTDPKGTVEDPASSDAHLVVAEGSSYSFGNKLTGSTTEVELTLVNNGILDAENIALSTDLLAPYNFTGGAFPGTGGSCNTATLTAQTSCSIFVEYSPSIGGSFGGLFILDYESAGVAKTFSFGLQGSSGSANVTVSDGPVYEFDNTLVGEVSEHTFTVSNGGALTARFLQDGGTLVAPFRYKGLLYPGTGGTCADEIAPAGSCTVVLEFAPTLSGLSASPWGLGFVSGGTGGAVGLSLQASSGVANLSITDSPLYTYALTFTGATANRTFTISNNGSFEASLVQDLGELDAPFSFPGGYPGTGGLCGATIAAGATCTIVVRFSPTLPETFSDTLELEYFDGQETQVLEIDLAGSGRGAILEATIGTTFDFNLVAKNTLNEGTITLSNTGNFAASAITITDNLAGMFRYKGFAYPGTGGTCATTIAAGATCTMIVEYLPISSGLAIVNHSDTTVVRHNPGSGTTVNLTLTVQGRAGLGTLSFGTAVWGTVRSGSTPNERSVTLTNGGTFPSTTIAVQSAMSPPFGFAGGSFPGTTGTCGNNIAPGGSCTIRLTFQPVGAGDYLDNLTLSYSDGYEGRSASLPLSGTAALAVLAITDAPSYDFASVAYNSANASRTFTVSNTGGWAASAMSLSGIAAPFTRTGGSCGTTLAAGANCTHIIRFAPTAQGVATDNMLINYNDGTDPQLLDQEITGTGENTAPVANTNAVSVPRNDPGQLIVLTSSDANGDPRTYEIMSLPSNGVLDVGTGVLGGNSVTYTPTPGYDGPDSFTFRVNDGTTNSGSATISITVDP